MAPRGLRVGDTFVDSGRYFVVDKVLPSGDYISHQIEKPKRTTRKTAEK